MRRYLKSMRVALMVMLPSALNAQEVQTFSRLGLGLSSVTDGHKTSNVYPNVDVIGDTRAILPWGLLLSVQVGLADRGYNGYWDGVRNYLWAHNVFAGLRPGYSLRLGSMNFRLDLMAGVHVSYDLWGREYYDGSSYSIWNVQDYNHFDFGVNACASLVIYNLELYFELRRGLRTMFKDNSVKSIVYAFGVGWDF